MLQLRGEQQKEIGLISQCVADMSNNDYLFWGLPLELNVHLAAAGVQNRHDLDLFLFAWSQTTKYPFLSGFFPRICNFLSLSLHLENALQRTIQRISVQLGEIWRKIHSGCTTLDYDWVGECSASQCAVNTLISKQLSTQSVAYYCLQFGNTILSREINWKRSTPIDEGLSHILKITTFIVSDGSSRGNFDVYLCNSVVGLAIWCSSIYSVWYTLWLCNATKKEKTKSIIECDVAWLVFNGNFASPSTDNGVGELVINIWAHCWLNYEFTISFPTTVIWAIWEIEYWLQICCQASDPAMLSFTPSSLGKSKKMG